MRVPAARDAVLFLWAVNGLLPEALEVMARLGIRVPQQHQLGQALDRARRLDTQPTRTAADRPPRQPPTTHTHAARQLRPTSKARTPLAEARRRLRTARADVSAASQARAVRARQTTRRLDRLGQRSRSRRMNDRLLTAKEVAELLAVPESWVREATREGRIPHLKLGRYRRYQRRRDRSLARRKHRRPNRRVDGRDLRSGPG